MNKSIRTEIIINASSETLWSILTDFESYKDWNPFIVEISGKLEKGSRLKNTLKNGDKTFVFKPVIVELDSGKSFAWLGSLFFKGLFDGRHYFQIEELAQGQVKLIHGEDFSGIFSSAILKKIAEDTRANFIAMNQALRQKAEEVTK
jgi:hypothetical protein